MPQYTIALDQLPAAIRNKINVLPPSLRVLLDNSLSRTDAWEAVVQPYLDWLDGAMNAPASLWPTRILMQDTAGVAALVNFAAVRDAMAGRGDKGAPIEPMVPIDLVIDHSVQVDAHGSPDALSHNEALEVERHKERYIFFKWCEQAFSSLRIVPPGRGICHQINLEDLCAIAKPDDKVQGRLVPEILIGTDSHTTMVNALGIMGWGVGGLEAEMVAWGGALHIALPPVTRIVLSAPLPPDATATDAALHLTRFLRNAGVVGHMLEFSGDALATLSLTDRATIANMTPEYGAMVSLFPVDAESVRYLSEMGRTDTECQHYERYAKAVGLWHNETTANCYYTQSLAFDLASVLPVMAGPARPQDLADFAPSQSPARTDAAPFIPVVIAAITSCTNTANPVLMVMAGLAAKKANALGLRPPEWVKCSLAPGSQRIAAMLKSLGLLGELEALGFHLVGFGCTSCVGNSGDLSPSAKAWLDGPDGAQGVAFLSGNRNFPYRIHPAIRDNYLCAPHRVVVAALFGRLVEDWEHVPIGHNNEGAPLYARDIMPDKAEAERLVRQSGMGLSPAPSPASPPAQTSAWDRLPVQKGPQFAWDSQSLKIQRPPFIDLPSYNALQPIENARPLLVLGDDITTDHISPIGRIAPQSAAAEYLIAQGLSPSSLGSFGAYRGNHEVMVRGGFDHPLLGNRLSPDAPSKTWRPDGMADSVFAAAAAWGQAGVPLVICAGQNYGCGSARDWAAKATRLLGIKAVLARSFERIHRSNLIAVGVLPIEVSEAIDWVLSTAITITGFDANPDLLELEIEFESGQRNRHHARLAINSPIERDILSKGGIFGSVGQIGSI